VTQVERSLEEVRSKLKR